MTLLSEREPKKAGVVPSRDGRGRYIAIGLVSLLCLSTVYWIPRVSGNALLAGIFSENWISAFVILGLTLLAGVFCEFFLPKGAVKLAELAVVALYQHRVMAVTLFLSFLFIALVAVNEWVLHSFMNSGDEHSCYFLAECIRSGKWFSTTPEPYHFFETTHIGSRDGKWFSVYPPGWPMLLALGLTFNMSHWINPILAVGATLFFIRVGERLFRFDVAFLGMIAIAFTPFFLLNNASYFSHTTALFMIALFLYSFLRWKDHPERGLWATISALALGFGLGTRYLTMAAICGPFLLFELIEILSKRKYWSRTHTIFAVTTAIMLGLNLFYNYLITGGFFEAPNHYHHSWERLGFHSNHTALEALRDVVARFVFLMDWIPPILVVAYFFVLVRLRKYHHLSTPFKIGFIYLPFAYLFYYSWGGNQYGPRYYFEGLPFLAIAVVGMLESSWRNSSLRIRKFVIGVCLAAMIGNVYSLAKYSLFFNAASSQRKALYSVAEETVEKPAIVFIRGFLGDTLVMSQEDAVRNHPDLNSDIIYAHHLGTRNEELVSKHPERTAYLGWFDRQQKKPFLTLLESEVLV